MYTDKQLKVIYKALKGADLLRELQHETGYNRQSIFNTFNSPHIQCVPKITEAGIRLLKANGLLEDMQALTEILN